MTKMSTEAELDAMTGGAKSDRTVCIPIFEYGSFCFQLPPPPATEALSGVCALRPWIAQGELLGVLQG
jgi:hypothetical protein